MHGKPTKNDFEKFTFDNLITRPPFLERMKWLQDFGLKHGIYLTLGLVILIALMVMSGWWLKSEILLGFVPHLTPMKFNAALSFIFISFAFLGVQNYLKFKWAKQFSYLTIGLIGLISLLSIIEFTFMVDFKIDNLFVLDTFTDPQKYPGRMALVAAILFLMACFSLFTLDHQRASIRVLNAITIISGVLTAKLVILGYIFGVSDIIALPFFNAIPLLTAVEFFLFFCALFLALLERGRFPLLISSFTGGKLVRRLLPVILLLPLLLGWVRLLGQEMGFIGQHFGLALQTLMTSIILTLTVIVLARILNKIDIRRAASELALQNLNHELEQRVNERTKELTVVNQTLIKEIEERQSFEDELKQAKLLAESANVAKTAFLANMSHEIRTPLNAILGFSQIALESKKFKHLPLEMLQFLKHIKIAGENLTELINNILDLSKIEAGLVTLVEETFNLSVGIKNIFELNTKQAQKKKIHYHCEISTDLPLAVQMDRSKLNQILMNLLDNAIKFTPQEKSVKLLVKKMGNSLIIVVQDTGIGIPLDRQEKIFRIFEQVDSSSTRKYGGSGLGLTITRRFVTLLGGKITLESTPTMGTTFTVQLPMKIVDVLSLEIENKSVLQSEIPIFSKDNVIVLIEDEQVSQLLVKTFFKKLGLNILIASDGLEGLATVERLSSQGHLPNLILLDMHLPYMDGLVVIQKLRQNPLFENIPIVAITAEAMSDQQQSAFAAGVTGYITKPVDFKKLEPFLLRYLHHIR